MADDITPALLAGIAVKAEALTTESQRLSEELHHRGEELNDAVGALKAATDAFRRAVRGEWIWRVVILAVMVGLVFIAIGNRSNGQVIRSCTTPGGACFERSQAQTANAVSQLLLGFCNGLYPREPAKAQECGVAAIKVLQR
jgi:hypothetical protein